MKPVSKNTLNTWIANPYILLLIPVLAFLLIGGAAHLAAADIRLPDSASYTNLLPEKKAVSLFQMTCEFVANIRW